MSNQGRHKRQVLKFQHQRYENVTPEILVKSAWVSTSLALILTLPPLGIFVTLYETGSNIALAAAIGFGLHFAILAFSKRISKILASLFDE